MCLFSYFSCNSARLSVISPSQFQILSSPAALEPWQGVLDQTRRTDPEGSTDAWYWICAGGQTLKQEWEKDHQFQLVWWEVFRTFIRDFESGAETQSSPVISRPLLLLPSHTLSLLCARLLSMSPHWISFSTFILTMEALGIYCSADLWSQKTVWRFQMIWPEMFSDPRLWLEFCLKQMKMDVLLLFRSSLVRT